MVNRYDIRDKVCCVFVALSDVSDIA